VSNYFKPAGIPKAAKESVTAYFVDFVRTFDLLL